MATRLTIPDSAACVAYGLRDSGSFSRTTVRFGDGFEMRASEGINPTMGRWSLTWRNVSLSIKEEIFGFLMARRGVETFFWKHPLTGVKHTVLCPEVPEVSYDNPRLATITATFEERFDG